ncbi:MAG: NUDIX hydrolase [Desulfatiglandaceae bacterium]
MHPEKWKSLFQSRDNSHGIVTIRTDRAVSPRTGDAHDFFVLETPPWVNIIPVTADRRVVMVRQYRHGTGEVTLEIPGGIVEKEDSPESGALRELEEETGYTSSSVSLLGAVHPNPAIQDTVCYTYLALNAIRVGEQRLDEKEDIEVVLRPLEDIPSLILKGYITHALVLAAFYRFYMELPAERLETAIANPCSSLKLLDK